jgi:hypothetical protein
LHSALQDLHPPASDPLPVFQDVLVGEDFIVDEVAEALKSFPPGSAGGFTGLMAQHLRCEKPTATYLLLLQQIACVCSDFAWGRLLRDVATALAGARLIALGKQNGGVRPIAIGELFRRLAGKLFIARY